MAVAFDAKMTGGNGDSGNCEKATAVTSISSTGMTVGVGATVLVAILHFQNSATGTVAVTWDGTPMTVNPSNDIVNGASRNVTAYLFSPASGNKTLAASWTGASDVYMSCISFTGSGIAPTDVDNFVEVNSGTTVTVASTTDGATVACWGTNGSGPTTNFTQIFVQSDLAPGAAGSYGLGGTSNGHTFTGAGGSIPAGTGIHILAAAAAAGQPTRKRFGGVQFASITGNQRQW